MVEVLLRLLNVAVPVITVQEPLPARGALPVRLTEFAQSVWDTLTWAMPGSMSRCTETEAVAAGQMPLVIVH